MHKQRSPRRGRVPDRIRNAVDWGLLTDSAVISVGMFIARFLGFAFFLVLARAFDPADYGVIQYSISVAGVVAIVTMPFGQHVLARFLGKYHEDEDRIHRIISNTWVVLAVLFVLTLLIAVPALNALDRFDPGVLVIFMGLTIFYAYWGLARGLMTPVKLIIAYLGSNIVQIIATIVIIQALGLQSTSAALMIYGLSYLLPLLLLQIFKPFPIGLKLNLIDGGMIRELLTFSVPIWVSHASYILYANIDVLMLERFASDETLGFYTLAKTLAMVFYFLPGGISTILMPKVASTAPERHRRMMFNMVGVTVVVNAVLLIGYVLLGEWFVQTAFGAEYSFDPVVAFVMALGMIIFGVDSVIAAVVVGRDRPRDESLSRTLAVIAAALTGWLLIPPYGALGAAFAVLVGAVVGLAVYGFIYFANRRPRRARIREEDAAAG